MAGGVCGPQNPAHLLAQGLFSPARPKAGAGATGPGPRGSVASGLRRRPHPLWMRRVIALGRGRTLRAEVERMQGIPHGPRPVCGLSSVSGSSRARNEPLVSAAVPPRSSPVRGEDTRPQLGRAGRSTHVTERRSSALGARRRRPREQRGLDPRRPDLRWQMSLTTTGVPCDSPEHREGQPLESRKDEARRRVERAELGHYRRDHAPFLVASAP